MKRKLLLYCVMAAAVFAFSAIHAYARPGYCGFEGGISSGYVEGQTTYKYSEPCFLTGEAIELHGTVIIKRTLRQDVVRSTYTYTLENKEKEVTLRRVMTYDTKVTKTNDSQTVEETVLSRTPSEILDISGRSYVLTEFSFSRSNIIDHKAAVDYYAGNIRGKKTYTVSGQGGGTVTVELSGDFYGYLQYWGSTEAGKFMYYIKHEGDGATPDSWGGMAESSYCTTFSKRLDYSENLPELISFQGGYIEVQCNKSTLQYRAFLPEFDSQGNATDVMVDYKGNLSLESFPSQKRLPVPSLNHIKGHWAEKDIAKLYSLGIFQGGEKYFKPEQAITREEFAAAIVNAAKAVPEDPELKSGTASRKVSRGSKEEVVSPFKDVPADYAAFESIKEAYDRGLVLGTGDNMFSPDGTLTRAEALTILIRALGLENMGPGQNAVTVFRDNDEIPGYARNAAYVAHKIGLVQGDMKGRLAPNEELTKSQAAALLNRFIQYMREDMASDYKERILW